MVSVLAIVVVLIVLAGFLAMRLREEGEGRKVEKHKNEDYVELGIMVMVRLNTVRQFLKKTKGALEESKCQYGHLWNTYSSMNTELGETQYENNVLKDAVEDLLLSRDNLDRIIYLQDSEIRGLREEIQGLKWELGESEVSAHPPSNCREYDADSRPRARGCNSKPRGKKKMGGSSIRRAA